MFVIYHSSDSFASVTGVSMLSLFENNKDISDIRVLYIGKGLSSENKEKLIQIASDYQRSIEFMEMPNWSERLNVDLQSSKKTWLGFGYNRLFLTEILPDEIERVLYLDSDTVIEGSLRTLWNTEMEEYYLAGVDDCLSKNYRRLVGLKKNGTYINSGMLLINLKKWREDCVIDRFINIIREKNGYFVFNEQTILNSVFEEKIKILPQKYNVNSLVFLFEYHELMRLRRPYKFSYSEEEYYDAKENPVITHYTGNFLVRRRPWVLESDHPHVKEFLNYRNMTPWRNEPLARDERAEKRVVYANICHKLPRRIMIGLVSFLYNRLRPISFWRRIKKNQISR